MEKCRFLKTVQGLQGVKTDVEFEQNCRCHFTSGASLVKVLFWSFFLFVFFLFFSTCQCRSAAQQASLALRQTPSLLTRPRNHPAICTCSNYYPITNKYRTITTRNPHAQAAAGWEKNKKNKKIKNPGREKLAESNNGSDQTAINQQRKHLHVKNLVRSPYTFGSNAGGGREQRQVGGHRCEREKGNIFSPLRR